MSNDAPAVNSQALGPNTDSPAPSIRGIDSSSYKRNRRESFEAAQLNGDTMSARTTPVSVAVDPVALITTECITVTSAMRKHARWAHSSVSAILGGSSSPMNPSMQSSRPSTPRDDSGHRTGHKTRSSSGLGGDGFDDGGLANRWGLRGKKGKSMQDNPLMAGFGRLRRELTGCKGNVEAII
jgi:brefeldin A-resistance guanine nucleotide exchange factor 1